jgi:hypothetical protein
MRGSIVYTFPTVGGYQFFPSEVEEKSQILSSLQSAAAAPLDSIGIAPFINTAWISHRLSGSKAIFIAGVVTRGIKNEVHRGSYSTWTATKIVARKTSFSADEGMSILREVVNDFMLAATSSEPSPPFFAAFQKYVAESVNPAQLEQAIDQLIKQSHNEELTLHLSKSGFFVRLGRMFRSRGG